MNKKKLMLWCFALLVVTSGVAQINLGKIINGSIKKAQRNVENRIENKIDKTVDKTLDNVEDSISGTVNGKPKKTQKVAKSEVTVAKSISDEADQPTPILNWAKYDFVPGSEIIFEDDFAGEQNGEFPSRWDVTKGAIEIAELGGEKVVWFKKTNSNGPDAILPYLKTKTEDYLPDEFTVEMDVYFHADNKLNSEYYIFLYDRKNQMKIMSPSKPVRIEFNRVHYDFAGDYYPGQNKLKPIEGWRHVAISFNKRALKGYLDDTRLLNIPNCEFNPTGIMITAHNVSGTGKPFIKNVRIAKGAVPLYDKFLVNGKFVTTGIKFDVNKATIKPESMGTINYVVKMMTDHPELKFSVEGHTDSDGDDISNKKLSEARAKAVVEAMINLGISSNRLVSKGHGETKPMIANDSPEGKAQNRRVEFVRQ